MTAALADVLRRRSALVARSEALRRSLVRQSPVLVRPFGWADKARRLANWCAHRPLLLAGAMGAVSLLWPRRTFGWSMRAWAGWRLWRRLQPQLPWNPPAR